MAVTQTKYIVPVHLSEPTSPYPLRCRQELTGQRISTSYDSSCFARDNLLSSEYRYQSLGCNSDLFSQPNGNFVQLPYNLNESLSTEPLNQENMTSHNHHLSESRVISNDIKIKQRSKSMGNFASSLAKSRRRKSSDSRNNNTHRGGYTNIRNEHNSAHHAAITTTVMASILLHDNQNSDEARVPVNGEATPSALEPTSTVEVLPRVVAATSGPQPIRSDSYVNSRKNSLVSSSSIGNLNPYDQRFRDFMIGGEPWKDDCLSLSSSFSSSLSSLPSPPSPASPPSYRPQSLPQTADIVLSDSELLSSSLPETAYQTAFNSASCGGSPRKKRVKDSEGFIRRAACVCLNEAETEVLLVSSKSSSEVWLVPGGGLEEGEEAEQAAIREAYEEAGVRGTILAYLGLFESRPEVTSSGKKHRTAVYVVRVLQEEDHFPEAVTLGRQTKWMTVDDALAQLSRHRPRQSVYLQLLRATRLNARTGDDSSVTSTNSASTFVKQTTGPTATLVTGGEATRRKEGFGAAVGDACTKEKSETPGVVPEGLGAAVGDACTKEKSETPGVVPFSKKPEELEADSLDRLGEVQESRGTRGRFSGPEGLEGDSLDRLGEVQETRGTRGRFSGPEGLEGDSLDRLEKVHESQFEQEVDEGDMPSDLQLMAELQLNTPRNAAVELNSASPVSTSSESLVAVRKNSSDLRSDVTLESDSSSCKGDQETDDGEETTKEGEEGLLKGLKKTLDIETEGNSLEESLDPIEGTKESS